MPVAAYTLDTDGTAHATLLTRGPWDPGHQHAGPPIALCCRTIEREAAAHGLDHVARLTVNLMRPVPVGPVTVDVEPVHVGRRAAHFSARLTADGRECLRLTALVLRSIDLPVAEGTPGHPLPAAPLTVAEAQPAVMPFHRPGEPGYADLVENRSSDGRMFSGPCAVWFRLNHPLIAGEAPSPYQRVMVAADSGNGISAVLDIRTHRFVNADLTVNLLRRPVGEWVCLEARTALGGNGAGLAESALYDQQGLIGRATQTLVVQPREPA
jgi:acyl-coenzyme A thioesterase PaaI-like protein